VEPYSLRYAISTGNTNLFVYEVSRGRRTSNAMKSFNFREIESVEVLRESFQPRWMVVI
jgi:hypothetical protein